MTLLGGSIEISRMNKIAVKMDRMKVRHDVSTLGILVNTFSNQGLVKLPNRQFETVKDVFIDLLITTCFIGCFMARVTWKIL